MDASQRHVLDVVPVGLQIWEATGDDPRSLTLRYANAESDREAGIALSACVDKTVVDIFPATVFTATSLHAVAVAQRPETLEFSYAGDERLGETWWRFQATPIGGRSVLAPVRNITPGKLAQRSPRGPQRVKPSIPAEPPEGGG